MATSSHPFPFLSVPRLSKRAETGLALHVAKDSNMEKVERLIRTWVSTQQEAQITETVAGKPISPPDSITMQAKIVKRYPGVKSRC